MDESSILLRSAISIGFLLLLVIAMVAIGLSALRYDNTKRATIGVGISHGIGCFMLPLVLIYVVPEFRKAYVEFDLEVPWISELLISISDAAIRAFFYYLPVLAGFLVAIIALFYFVHHNPESRVMARLISASLTGLLTLCFFFVMWSLVMPLFALREGGLP